jgi:hypothetical protein
LPWESSSDNMGMGKIFIGAIILIAGIVAWLMLASPQGALTQLMFATPTERMNFVDALRGLQVLYFLAVIGGGIGLIIWGSQG